MAMQKVLIQYDNKEIPAFFLAHFHRMQVEILPVKGLFGRIKSRLASVDRHDCLVFIPWKHREKELALISMSDIIGFDRIVDEDVISVKQYISSTTDDPYGECEILDFVGYKFIYECKNFIADLIDGSQKPYEIFYQLYPELLQEEFDEEQ